MVEAPAPARRRADERKYLETLIYTPGRFARVEALHDALESLGDELSIIVSLLEYCLPAEDGIVAMKAVLESLEALHSPK